MTNILATDKYSPDEVRPDFVPKDSYLDPAFVKIEAEHLWPKVWQVACRLEEIPKVGNYVLYEVANESLIIMRTDADTVRAYHNVCPHRGRPLIDNRAGSTRHFFCGFHGWKWNLDGENIEVVDRGDWGDCLKDEDIRLKQALVDTWGGFVFINMDLNAEPLTQFLDPVNHICKNYEFEKLRYRWYRTVEFPCNWKLAVEAFNESYHVQTTHRQVLSWIEDYSHSGTYGRHSAFWYPTGEDGPLMMTGSSRLNRERLPDAREYILGFVEHFHHELGAMITPRAYEATQRLRTEVSADAPPEEVLMKWAQFQQEAAEEDGAGWPPITMEDIQRSHADWHVFPNTIYLHSSVDGVLWYRMRPHGDDPEKCIFDVWSLVRYAPGDEPPLEREYYTNWRDREWGKILTQDFVNLERMHKGMKSMAFRGLRTNPVQEQPVSNFHRALYEFVANQSQGGKEKPQIERSAELTAK